MTKYHHGRYDTPSTVAASLAAWAPRQVDSLLEPAAGRGNLLVPLLTRGVLRGRILCVDTDRAALTALRSRTATFLNAPKLRTITGDFLSSQVAQKLTRAFPEGFDCVVMNPPFLARRSRAEWSPQWTDVSQDSWLPVEARFLLTAIERLRPGGRLLAIVPSSLVSGDLCSAVRAHLLSEGSVRFVHELPPSTFPRLQASIYLLVFDRGKPSRFVTLLNHRLRNPERLRIRVGDCDRNRLDFSYHDARRILVRITSQRKELRWAPLGELANIVRGSGVGSKSSNAMLHTHHFANGFWNIGTRRPRARRTGKTLSRDILMARVHRTALALLGLSDGNQSRRLSDCIYRIRAHDSQHTLRLLYGLRSVLGIEELRPLLLRGSGAKYVGIGDLKQFQIPVNLHAAMSKSFRQYVVAVNERNLEAMVAMEDDCRSMLTR